MQVNRQGGTMPNFTGQLKGTNVAQTFVSCNDTPGHQLILRAGTAQQSCSDPLFNNTRHNSYSSADVKNGNGHEHGYFVNEHANGDREGGEFEGTITMKGDKLSFEGTWKYTHGTGQFAGISGNGKFKGHMTSPSESEVSFEGNYQLKSGSRAA
jgi:hypothetical protein